MKTKKVELSKNQIDLINKMIRAISDNVTEWDAENEEYCANHENWFFTLDAIEYNALQGLQLKF